MILRPKHIHLSLSKNRLPNSWVLWYMMPTTLKEKYLMAWIPLSQIYRRGKKKIKMTGSDSHYCNHLIKERLRGKKTGFWWSWRLSNFMNEYDQIILVFRKGILKTFSIEWLFQCSIKQNLAASLKYVSSVSHLDHINESLYKWYTYGIYILHRELFRSASWI